ncbi:hypothetical protein CYMTET_51575 [Cymbomonas tetramitiformis]|uniref:Phosphoglycerate mutase-like protein n=1 Tax=Cymbomonas tetramitiformis TaxID=36881 RepID=A0AAE0BM02_9CHLO|nr:hypothetical protein CYMTET_51575 [Cymbomonas tetramitiformis]|eukprot:gene13428-15867_t
MSQTTIILIRHGARHDYANMEMWKRQCERLGLEASDPPLSALGHAQARQAADALVSEDVAAILCSPYLRVIQTAQPLAHRCGLPLSVENGLAEFHHAPKCIPPPGKRVGCYPEVDDEYTPLHAVTDIAVSESDGKESVVEYFRRIRRLACELPSMYAGRTVVCYSHAASVALVAALTSSSLQEAGKFAPCGIWKLVRKSEGSTWEIQIRGDENTGHITANDPSTFPWGFADTRRGLDWHESQWQESGRLGPTAANEDGEKL